MAYSDWPSGQTECTKEAPFEVERVADTSLVVCTEHLGSVLVGAKNVLWPPVITWEGLGPRPSNTFTKDQEDERIALLMQRKF